MERHYFVQGQEHRVGIRHVAGDVTHLVDGRPVELFVRADPDGSVLVRLGGVTYRTLVSGAADHTDVCVDGHHARLAHRPPSGIASGEGAKAPSGAGPLISPMTGRIRRVLVLQGDTIEAGTTLFVVEAMKMEFPVRSIASGRVRRVHVSEGEPVEMGAPLLELEALDSIVELRAESPSDPLLPGA
jgi:biotin carboxyl carrier protein